MSTHSSHLSLTTQYGPGPGPGVGYIGVASDIGVDQCARITISDGPSVEDDESYGKAEIHLNPEQAEQVGRALLAIAAELRARGSDQHWAGRTVDLDDRGLRWLEERHGTQQGGDS